jgi:hypothetical protein
MVKHDEETTSQAQNIASICFIHPLAVDVYAPHSSTFCGIGLPWQNHCPLVLSGGATRMGYGPEMG